MSNKESLRLDRWIFDSFYVTPQGLALYRIFSALFIFFFLLPSPEFYSFAGSLPADFFSPPPGPMMIFDGWPPESVFLLLHYLLISSLILLCLGLYTRIVSISTSVLLLVIYGFIYSMGKINHEILIGIMPLVMTFSGWEGAYSLDRKIRQKEVKAESWPLVLMALILGFMMFTAGFPKLLGGWLNINTHAVEGVYFKQYFVRGRQDLLAPYIQHLSSFFWEILDYLTICFEVGFLFAIINAKSTRIFICFAVMFHFSTMLILNITFLPNFLIYAAFLNWDKIDQLIKKDQYLSVKWRSPILMGVFMIIICTTILVLNSHYTDFLQSDWGMRGFSIVCIAVPIAIYHIGHQSFLLFKS